MSMSMNVSSSVNDVVDLTFDDEDEVNDVNYDLNKDRAIGANNISDVVPVQAGDKHSNEPSTNQESQRRTASNNKNQDDSKVLFVIDLEAEDEELELVNVARRILPPSFTNVNNNAAPLIRTNAHNISAPALNPATYQYVPPAIISLSLCSRGEFTAVADGGRVNPQTIDILRRVRGSKFDWTTKKWTFPLSSHDILVVVFGKYHIYVDPIPRAVLAAATLQHNSNNIIDGNDSDKFAALNGRLPKSLYSSLAPFQLEAVMFVMKNNGRAMICDEMGLGKTREAIAASVIYQQDWPVLIVSPSTAKHHWQAEVLSLLHPAVIDLDDITIIETKHHPLIRRQGSKSASAAFTYKFVIVSYNLASDLVATMQALPDRIKFNVIISDESHYLKTVKSKRTRCLLPLMQASRRLILLSGTPALSRPMELFTQLNAVDRTTWADMKAFSKRYCKVKKKKASQQQGTQPEFYQEGKGASNTRELHILLTNSFMIRRLKKDVLKQLPKKERRVVSVEVDDEVEREELKKILEEIKDCEKRLKRRRLLRKRKKSFATVDNDDSDNSDDDDDHGSSEDDLDADNQNNERGTGSAQNDEDEDNNLLNAEHKSLLMEIFNRSGPAKLPSILKHVFTFLSDPFSGKLLIFAHHTSVLDHLSSSLLSEGVEFIRIDGRVASTKRQGLVQRFQNSSSCRVAILSITAAGVAITLTAASNVYFAEMFWTPGSLVQAEDRAHRIGQTSTVKITYFLANGTVDDVMWPMIRAKLKVLGEIVEGLENTDLELVNTSTSASGNTNATAADGAAAESASEEVMDVETLQEIGKELAANELIDQKKKTTKTTKTKTKRKSTGKKGDDSDSDYSQDGDSNDEEDAAEEEEEDEGDDEEDEEEVQKLVSGSGDNTFESALQADDGEEPDQLAQLFMQSMSANQSAQFRVNHSSGGFDQDLYSTSSLSSFSNPYSLHNQHLIEQSIMQGRNISNPQLLLIPPTIPGQQMQFQASTQQGIVQPFNTQLQSQPQSQPQSQLQLQPLMFPGFGDGTLIPQQQQQQQQQQMNPNRMIFTNSQNHYTVKLSRSPLTAENIVVHNVMSKTAGGPTCMSAQATQSAGANPLYRPLPSMPVVAGADSDPTMVPMQGTSISSVPVARHLATEAPPMVLTIPGPPNIGSHHQHLVHQQQRQYQYNYQDLPIYQYQQVHQLQQPQQQIPVTVNRIVHGETISIDDD